MDEPSSAGVDGFGEVAEGVISTGLAVVSLVVGWEVEEGTVAVLLARAVIPSEEGEEEEEEKEKEGT